MEEILHQSVGSLSHYLQGSIHPRWCRISSINSITRKSSKFSIVFRWFMCGVWLHGRRIMGPPTRMIGGYSMPFIGVRIPCAASRGPSCKESQSLYSWLIIIPIRTAIPETNMFTPENWWLEDDPFLFGTRPIFRGELLVSVSGVNNSPILQHKWQNQSTSSPDSALQVYPLEESSSFHDPNQKKTDWRTLTDCRRTRVSTMSPSHIKKLHNYTVSLQREPQNNHCFIPPTDLLVHRYTQK